MKIIKPIHCCLIDDDPEEIEIFKMALEDVGIPVNFTSYTNCSVAVQDLIKKEVNPDCVFLDLHLGVFSGKECLTEIKKTESIAHIPVVILSGSKIEHEVTEVKKLGAHEFILKPISVENLTQELNTYFSAHYNPNQDISL